MTCEIKRKKEEEKDKEKEGELRLLKGFDGGFMRWKPKVVWEAC